MSGIPSTPAPAFASKNGLLRTLTGDRRKLTPGQSALLIDVEFDMPRPLLVVLKLEDIDNPGSQVSAEAELRIGVNRAEIDSELLPQATSLSRVVLARSLALTVRAFPDDPFHVATPNLGVRAVVVPMDVQVPPSFFGSSDASAFFLGGPDPLVDAVVGNPFAQAGRVNQTVVATILGWAQRGMTIYNDSAADLYILEGGVQRDPANPLFGGTIFSAVTAINFTTIVRPGETARVDWTGPVQGVWLVAGAGGAQVTVEHS